MNTNSKYTTGKKISKPVSKQKISPIEEKHSQVESVLKSGDSELIAKAIRNILKKDEN